MKYLKYIFITLISGVIFGVGFLLALIYILPLFQKHDLQKFHKNEIARIENEISISCIDLYNNALTFAEKDIGNIINSGMKGDDWVAMISSDQKSFIDSTEKKILKCNTVQASAEKLGLNWPVNQRKAFHLHLVYSSLKTFTTRYGDKPASSQDLRPHALEQLMFEYQNLKD